jgi:hypothetical protein
MDGIQRVIRQHIVLLALLTVRRTKSVLMSRASKGLMALLRISRARDYRLWP